MFDLSRLQQKSPVLWEIPKNFRSDMRVPARVYSHEAELKKIANDRSLEQLVNTTTLPGIQKYAIAMPDVHEGYGVAVGTVYATDTKRGSISPGAIGYDINCLTGDSKILAADGYWLHLKSFFDSNHTPPLATYDKKQNTIITALILLKMKRWAGEVLKIHTKSGDTIRVTKDHPLFTSVGKVDAGKLGGGDLLVRYHFEGVPFTQPAHKIILTERKLRHTLKALKKQTGTPSHEIIVRKLKERKLLPLYYDNNRLPSLLRLFGFILGDGSVNFIGKKQDGVIHFAGQPTDLEDIRCDIEKLGYKPPPVRTRTRPCVFSGGKHSHKHSEMSLNASSLVILLYALGMPIGRKVAQPYEVPLWIRVAELWHIRLFLSALFGAELRMPHRRLDRNGTFNAPVFTMAKEKSIAENGRKFLQQLASLLEHFGVEAIDINVRREHKSTDGVLTNTHELTLSPKTDSLLSLWCRVGFAYNRKRAALASVAAQYLKMKRQTIREKQLAVVQIQQLLKRGTPYSCMHATISSAAASRRFIEDTGRKIRGGVNPGSIQLRIPSNFMCWQSFLDKYTFDKEAGLVLDEIISIEKEDTKELVYDFTINHPDHNFIANNFVVSNCGVRLLRTNTTKEKITPKLSDIGRTIFAEVPSGVGRGGRLTLKGKDLDAVLEGGARRMLSLGYAQEEDLKHIESGGVLLGARPDLVSERAKARGRDQLGTMGAGNHFVEVGYVETIFDESAAKKMNLEQDTVTVLIHTGSRGLGHQVATDYIRIMDRAMPSYGIHLPDRELASVPFQSKEGQEYFAAMKAAANFAFANRTLITFEVREAFKQVFGKEAPPLSVVYDLAHNIAKIEEYEIDGKRREVVVHRKGATRAFPGEPVLIPGSMGTASYVLLGQEASLMESFGSSAHGAGRRMSRTEARKQTSAKALYNELHAQGIVINAGSKRGLVEEAPLAYKDIDDVVNVTDEAGIAKKVARLKPLSVIKG